MLVEIVNWNPVRSVLPGRLGRNRIGRHFPVKRPINNFGDLLGPILVNRVLEHFRIDPQESSAAKHRLLSIGSIMAMAYAGDTIWGAGVNGRNGGIGAAPNLDVRAVRGPVTKRILEQAGTHVPNVFGDPGLLWSRFFPRDLYESGGAFAPVVVIPHFMEPRPNLPYKIINPCGDPHRVIRQIVSSKFVVSSSLHGIVLAESYGISARLLRPRSEPLLKYVDYYEGTGRPDFQSANSVTEALEMGGEPPAIWDADGLLEAFPADLWRG